MGLIGSEASNRQLVFACRQALQALVQHGQLVAPISYVVSEYINNTVHGKERKIPIG